MKNQVKLIGYIKPFSKDLDLYFRSSKVFVLPSICESMPRTVLEAMSFGVPVVTSNFSFNEWLVKPDQVCAALADPNDISEFAQKIIALLNDSGLRTKMIENGINVIKNHEFDWDTIAIKLTKLFREIITNTSK